MNSKLYYFRGYFRTISLIGGLLSGLAGMLNLMTGDYIALLMFIVCILSFFQYRWATQPFIEITGTEILVRLTLVITKKINLLDIAKIETPKNKRIILSPKEGKKITIGLNYLVEEDQSRLLLDLQAIMDGRLNGDFSAHLVEED